MGQLSDARRRINEASRWIAEANRGRDDPSGTQPNWADWYEPIVYPLLLHEAESLIGDEAGARDSNSEKIERS